LLSGFQWAPTLGGECYTNRTRSGQSLSIQFQWAPTLGGECYLRNLFLRVLLMFLFQWAPTLGGECYFPVMPTPYLTVAISFNGHPPLGVNATCGAALPRGKRVLRVSMGTHPWG